MIVNSGVELALSPSYPASENKRREKREKNSDGLVNEGIGLCE